MSYATQSVRYVENDVLTRSPEWLVPLMYEHLLISLRRVVVQIENKDYAGKAESLGKANAIVGELLGTLDRENGGEIADALAGLYGYFAVQLLDAGMSKEVGSLPRLIELVEELHQAWVEAAEQIAPRTAGRASLSVTAA